MTNNNGNNNGNNGKKSGKTLNLKKILTTEKAPVDAVPRVNQPKFEQQVVLRQSPIWSRAILWSIMGVATFSVGWASIAKMEQVVLAQGLLKPEGAVKELQVPLNGVVQEVHVKDGEKVTKGQLLVTLDTQASQAEKESLLKIRDSLVQETKFYRIVMDRSLDPVSLERKILELNIPQEVAFLARNRTELIAENQLFRIQLGEEEQGTFLSPESLRRLEASQAEENSRAAAAQLQIEQLEKQLNQNQVKLRDAQEKLATDKATLAEIKQRNEQAIAKSEESLKIDEDILSGYQPLIEEGAIAQLQVDSQRKQVNDRYRQLVELRANGTIEYQNQQQQVDSRLAEIEQLLEEEQRLRLQIAQATEELTNTTSLSEKNVRDRIAANQQRIAELDSQLNKLIVENEKRIAEVDSQVSRAEQTLRYQEIFAPVDGIVFDLKAAPGYVPQPGPTEPILKIVPIENLIAEVYITNQDIGFVRENMDADVRIDTFPFSDYGDIQGKVLSVGSDALPPDQQYNFYRFPAKIKLDEQVLVINDGDREIPLQSGMSVSVNIKIREDRTVLGLITEGFTRTIEAFKQMRS